MQSSPPGLTSWSMSGPISPSSSASTSSSWTSDKDSGSDTVDWARSTGLGL
ncbi:hypothetical protein DPMN_093726 [Dreissena polymorpha]|uniref:Uncharacterized protein n=1 Tax=Dreissena polymorpha TaxID=45954 RepID=A0A9D4L6A2_DREPO|nr:hypothetical protein DPMN_093726 [Dreissena polymorpha]